MREMLEPVFGANGAVVAQFVITLIVVLALVAVVVWLVRRYSAAAGIGSTMRGRLPRLAIIDAMAVDQRRKLVLVRRDNVEHLILIGGPTDIVVEPGIVRTRAVSQRTAAQPSRPSAAPPAAAMPPQAPAEDEPPAARRAEPNGADQPIPFPPRRAERPPARREIPRYASTGREAEALPQRRVLRAAAPSEMEPPAGQIITPFAEPPPVRAEPDFLAAPIHDQTTAEDGDRIAAAGIDEAGRIETAPEGAERAEAEEETQIGLFASLPDHEDAPGEPAPAATEVAADEPATAAPDSATSARVNDLEREMARLLGEISGRRSSS